MWSVRPARELELDDDASNHPRGRGTGADLRRPAAPCRSVDHRGRLRLRRHRVAAVRRPAVDRGDAAVLFLRASTRWTAVVLAARTGPDAHVGGGPRSPQPGAPALADHQVRRATRPVSSGGARVSERDAVPAVEHSRATGSDLRANRVLLAAPRSAWQRAADAVRVPRLRD